MERTILTGRCERKGHRIFRVIDTGARLVIEAPRYAAGRERKDWTPAMFPVTADTIRRYGCACGRSELLSHREMLADIERGITTWIIAGSNISRKTRLSVMGESASG